MQDVAIQAEPLAQTAPGTAETAAAAGSGEILGPFNDMVQRVTSVAWDTTAANIPNGLHWRMLLLTAFLGMVLFLIRGGHGSKGADGRARKVGLLEFLVPRDIYTHISARVDVWLWILERILRPLWAVSLFATVAPAVEKTIISSMQFVFGVTPAVESNFAWMLTYSAAILLCYDFIFYAIHYTMHKVPALWAIHKVHHSAEVLTPMTRTREHFVAGPIWATGAAVAYAIPGGVFAYLFDGGITQATIFNIGFFTVLFGFNGNFRHYHIAFHYPRWLSKWIQSPAMHHTHHSYLEKHWDTNFAAVTSIWDRMFGTIYIPAKDEYTPWGLGPKTQGEYRTFWQNAIAPFRDWYKMLHGGDSPLDAPGPKPEDAIKG